MKMSFQSCLYVLVVYSICGATLSGVLAGEMPQKSVPSLALLGYTPHRDDMKATQNQIEVQVMVPVDTPSDGPIYLVGNIPALGAWRADGLKLEKVSESTWRACFQAVPDSEFECKVTRGTWSTVEKSSSGSEIPNRKLHVVVGKPIVISVERWSDGALPHSSLTGNVKSHKAFFSEILRNSRDLLVYLPPDYEMNTGRRYPVLYMHDGQNVFDSASSFQGVEWSADETAERLIKSGRLAPLIIVAVANTSDRMNEYTPVCDEESGGGGKGQAYGRFLVEEVKPFIDKTYRTFTGRASTGIAGSSLGGLVSLYIAALYPDVFGKCGAISPSIWWADRWILSFLATKGKNLLSTRIWIDLGTKEGDNPENYAVHLQNLHDLQALLVRCGLKPGKEFVCVEIEGASHNEAAWAARINRILLDLFRTDP